MREVTDLPLGEEPEVGQVYLVRCVDLRNVHIPASKELMMKNFRRNQQHLAALPVIGQIHSDPEFRRSGGERPHIHMDIRFLTAWEAETLWEIRPEKMTQNTYPEFPILPHRDGFEVPQPFLHPKMCNYKVGDYRTIRLGMDDDYEKFQDEMSKHTLKLENPICAHHGTNLAGQPIRDGVITCSTHGATWCAKTGKYVRKKNTGPLFYGQETYEQVRCS